MIKFWLYRILVLYFSLLLGTASGTSVVLRCAASVDQGAAWKLLLDLQILGIQLFDLIDLSHGPVKSYPFERRLFAVHSVAFFNQADRLQHICNIIKSPYLGFQFLLLLVLNFIGLFAEGDLLCSLLQADDMLPGDKEVDELLAKNAQAFLFFVSFKFAAVLSGQLFFFLIRL